MRIAFFGTAAFGADVLEALTRVDGLDIVAVVSQPDRAAGRGRRPQSPPVAERARTLGLALHQPADASAEPRAADAGVVVAFGQLVHPPLLGAYPLFNLHPSLLPRWRGAAPVERAIMAGDTETGVAVIELVQQLDAGPIHALARFPIPSTADAGSVYATALELGVPLLAGTLLDPHPATDQSAEGVSYAHKLGAADRRIDWTRPAVEIDRQVRGLAPHIGARTELDGVPVTIWRARPTDAGLAPGVVSGPLVIGCGEGALEVAELQPAGRRRMGADEYLRGRRGSPGRAG